MLQECNSNNLVVIDRYGREKSKLQGNFEKDYGHRKMKGCHFTGEGSLIVWYCGEKSIKIVNLNDFSVVHSTKIFDFYEGDKSNFVVPTRCVSRDNCEIIILVFLIDGLYGICNYVRGEEPEYHNLADLLPKCKKTFII